MKNIELKANALMLFEVLILCIILLFKLNSTTNEAVVKSIPEVKNQIFREYRDGMIIRTTQNNKNSKEDNSGALEDTLEQTDTYKFDEVFVSSLNGLNLRKEPNINSEILTVLQTNTKLLVSDITYNENWKAVCYNNINGYVCSDYVSQTPVEILNTKDYSTEAIAKYLYKSLNDIGFSWWYKYAVAQAIQESGFNPYSENINGLDKGLFQYRITFWNPNLDIFNPYTQIDAYCISLINYYNACVDICNDEEELIRHMLFCHMHSIHCLDKYTEEYSDWVFGKLGDPRFDSIYSLGLQ